MVQMHIVNLQMQVQSRPKMLHYVAPQHALLSGPSAMQMLSQQHHAHIASTVTAMLPSDESPFAQAAVPQRRGRKRRAPPTVTASQITCQAAKQPESRPKSC